MRVAPSEATTKNLIESRSLHYSSSISTPSSLRDSINYQKREEFLTLVNAQNKKYEDLELKKEYTIKQKLSLLRKKLYNVISYYTVSSFFKEKLIPKEFYLGKVLEHRYEKELFGYYRYVLGTAYLVLSLQTVITLLFNFIMGYADERGNMIDKFDPSIGVMMGITSIIAVIFLVSTMIPYIYTRPLLLKMGAYCFIIYYLVIGSMEIYLEGILRFKLNAMAVYVAFYPIPTGFFLVFATLHTAILMLTEYLDAKPILMYINSLGSTLFIHFIGITVARIAQYASRKRFINGQFGVQRSKELLFETKKNDILLRNILPEKIIAKLSDEETQEFSDATTDSEGQSHVVFESYDDVAVLFIKINDFDKVSEQLNAKETVELLNEFFVTFDTIVEQYGIWRVKTIGNTYMAANGIPNAIDNPIDSIIDAALAIIHFVETKNPGAEILPEGSPQITINVGINTGPLVAGVIGINTFIYDIWGDTVNVASRMAYTSPHPMCIQLENLVYEKLVERVGSEVAFHTKGPYELQVKGKGKMNCVAIEKYAGTSLPAFLIDNCENEKENNLKSSLIAILGKKIESDKHLADFKEAEEYYPLAKMAKAMSRKKVKEDLDLAHEEKSPSLFKVLKNIIPIAILFKNIKLNKPFFKNNYKYYITSNRLLHVLVLLIWAFSFFNEYRAYSSKSLFSELEQGAPPPPRFVEMGINAVQNTTLGQTANLNILPVSYWLIFRVGVANILVILSSIPVFTPLYVKSAFGFYPFTLIAFLVPTFLMVLFSLLVEYDISSSIYSIICSVVIFYLEGLHYWVRAIISAFFSVAAIVEIILLGDVRAIVSIIPSTIVIAFLGQTLMFYTIAQQMDDAITKTLSYKKSKYLSKKRKTSEMLLKSILPSTLIARISRNADPSKVIAHYFESTSVLFSDICNFTKLSSTMEPNDLIKMLNFLFSNLDILGEQYHIQKVKTIGDSYEAVGGAPVASRSHFVDMLNFGLELLHLVRRYNKFEMRVGIYSGPIVSGVIGVNKIAFDIFGKTVRNAEVLEQTGVPMKLHVSSATRKGALKLNPNQFQFQRNDHFEDNELCDEFTYFVEPKQVDIINPFASPKGRKNHLFVEMSPKNIASPIETASKSSETPLNTENVSIPIDAFNSPQSKLRTDSDDDMLKATNIVSPHVPDTSSEPIKNDSDSDNGME